MISIYLENRLFHGGGCRNSWAQDQNNLKGVRVIFLLGQEEKLMYDELVRKEADLHGDILQVRAVDVCYQCSYHISKYFEIKGYAKTLMTLKGLFTNF